MPWDLSVAQRQWRLMTLMTVVALHVVAAQQVPSQKVWLLLGNLGGGFVEVVPLKGEVQVLMGPKLVNWTDQLGFSSKVWRQCYPSCWVSWPWISLQTVEPFHHGPISQGLETKGEDRDQGVTLVWQVCKLMLRAYPCQFGISELHFGIICFVRNGIYFLSHCCKVGALRLLALMRDEEHQYNGE